MSQVTRIVLTVAIAVIVTLVATTFADGKVAAQPGITSCFEPATDRASSYEKWMAQQIQSGRKNFVSVQSIICSW